MKGMFFFNKTSLQGYVQTQSFCVFQWEAFRLTPLAQKNPNQIKPNQKTNNKPLKT